MNIEKKISQKAEGKTEAFSFWKWLFGDGGGSGGSNG
jgi:hypothetical protein